MQGLTADAQDAFAIFETYLDGPADHPVGVAVSGGGDSVALLYALAQWGRRPLEVFCVDHGLNPDSGRWTDSVARHAQTLGAGFTALKWTGTKPSTGLSARARAARHALLADAARAKGVTVVCLAHTHDDIAEAQVMAEEGSTVGLPALWAPSPAWPQGRGVFLFRPFIGKRRAELRHFLTQGGIDWIEDPANENMASARARARMAVSQQVLVSPGLRAFLHPVRLYQDLSHLVIEDGFSPPLGQIVFDTRVFDACPDTIAHRRLAAAVVSAGGGDRLPRSDSIARLRSTLSAGGTATLCGARVERTEDRIFIVREAGELERRKVSPLRAGPQSPVMWDGRFEIAVDRPANIRASGQVRGQLDERYRNALNTLPVRLRTVVPVVVPDSGAAALPTGLPVGDISAISRPDGTTFACWVWPRFLAACGVFACESDCSRIGEKPQ